MNVAILTDLTDFRDSYSVTHVVTAQIAMLERYGHDDVLLIVSEECVRNGETPDAIRYLVPHYSPVNYASIHGLSGEHKALAEATALRLTNELRNVDVAFTHDWVSEPRKVPLAEALRLCADETRHVKFYHWIHSTPYLRHDWYDFDRYGPNHHLVYLNESDLGTAGANFNTEALFVPNITDPRIYGDFSDEACRIIDAMPGLMSADVVQIYPAAADRLTDKGVKTLIYLFAELKRQGRSVCCLVVDGWSGAREKEDLSYFMEAVEKNGLTFDEFRFSSQITHENGTSQRTIKELTSLSNLFACPSRGECGPLALPEAVLAGGVLPVVNEQVPQQGERIGGFGMQAPFTKMFQTPLRQDFEKLAGEIIDALKTERSCAAKTWVRQKLNMDAVYREYYEPILED